MFFQCSINREVELEGIGIHSGKISKVKLAPAPVDSGIVFKQENGRISERIRAGLETLVHTHNAITIGNGKFKIQTIEHFMAVFYALGITNLYVLVNGDELPILDGSAREIVKAIDSVGISIQNAFSDVFYIPYPLWIENDGRYLIALPGNEFKITYTIDFTSKSSAVGTQTAHFHIQPEIFKEAIAPARTFGFVEDIYYMRNNNLARGGSLENALVFTKDRLINQDLRFANECVRHKILDLIGDLSLAGCKIMGYFIAHKSGHSMDMEIVRKISKLAAKSKSYKTLPRELLKRKEMEFEEFRTRINLQ